MHYWTQFDEYFKYHKLFSKLKLQNSEEFIDKIIGKNDIKKDNKTIVESPFNNNEASEYILKLLLIDLSQLLNNKNNEVNFNNEETNIDFYEKSELKKSKDIYVVGEFIELVFNLYNKNNVLFSISTNNVKAFEQKLMEKV